MKKPIKTLFQDHLFVGARFLKIFHYAIEYWSADFVAIC